MTTRRQPQGFALRDPYTWPELAGLARRGEELGYRFLFLPEVGARDTLATVTGLAGETSTLRMGPGVVPLPSRSATLLAMAAVTAHERTGGRLVLGLGTGPAVPGALDRLGRTIVALREAFRTGRAELDGARIELGLLPADPLPIWIAALGPRAVRLAGEVADGVLLNWCTPERVHQARAEIEGAAEEAGRPAASVTVGVYVRAADAHATMLPMAAEYGGYASYARQFRAMGIDPRDPEAIVSSVCVVTADADAARARLEAYREAGADLPVVYPVTDGSALASTTVGETLTVLAP